MALSNAERQRRFRANRDKDYEKRQKYLEKGRDRYRKECQSKKRKPVEELTAREQRSIRKRWREQKRKDRARQKAAIKFQENLQTPPTSGNEMPQSKSQEKKRKQKLAKVYRDKKKVELELNQMKRRVESLRKKLQRRSSNTKTGTKDTPRSRTKILLRHFTPKQAKRSLFKCQVLLEAIRQKYKEKRKRDKADFTKFLCNQTLKKYKLKTETYRFVGYSSPKRNRPSYKTLTKREGQKVHKFYVRNDNSRMVTGKRQTKTLKKNRKQRRVLLHDLKTLYKKFMSEGKTKLSYSVFCRLRPFFVVFPRLSDRNTCMCKTCNNTEMMAEALLKADAISTDDLSTLINQLVCCSNCKDCMYRKCQSCSGKRLEVNKAALEKNIAWFEWKTKREIRTIKKGSNDEDKSINITVKEKQTGTVDALFDKFESQLNRYAQHIFRVYNQYEYFTKRKVDIKDDECILHIDYSENYVCGYGTEVQSVHFGASKKQVTLHTGIAITKEQSPFTFCTVSDSLTHGPEAVWAHLRPILTKIKQINPMVKKVEIFSDGPVTQYRQKANFYLASIKGKDYDLDEVSWSFFESGHGKGVPDAIGGTVKRQADRHIKYGGDITSAETLVTEMSKQTNIDMYLVSNEDIQEHKNALKGLALKPVPGTLNLHQVKCDGEGYISYRNLSCHCLAGSEHKGHTYDRFCLIDNNKQNSRVDTSQAAGKSSSEQSMSNRNSCSKKRSSKPVSDTKSPNVKDKKLPTKRKLQTKQHKPSKRKNVKVNVEKTLKVDYEKLLESLSLCQTFDDLRGSVSKISNLDMTVKPEEVSVYKNKLEVDMEFVPDIPDDIDTLELYPIQVNADGNCLPSCGSVFAFGNPDKSEEIRTHIIKELCENEEYYLDTENLNKGCINVTTKDLAKQYSQYSEYFVPGMSLDNHLVREIYRREVMSLTQNKSFMGIWQIFALSSILRAPIKSVYPNKGNPNVRNDLNRQILPRTENASQEVHILWTNTREDIPNEHWVPNHFVPLIPFEQTPGPVSPKINKKYNDKSYTHVDDKKTNPNDCSSGNVEKADLGMAINSINEKVEHKFETTHKTVQSNSVPDIKECLNSYVIVKFNGRPYPGLVQDVDNSELEVLCMHQLGKKKSTNCFFWPQKCKDLSWYNYSDIITLIPEPTHVHGSSHFTIDDNLFQYALSHCK